MEQVSYESALANKTKNYIVELYAFTKDYIDIWACDTASGHNKVLKISGIVEVEILGDWQMEEKHERRPIDSFRMCGDGHRIDHVKFKLTLRAKVLLTEEYPVT